MSPSLAKAVYHLHLFPLNMFAFIAAINSDGHIKMLKNKIQLDVTYYFIMLMLDSTYFGYRYAHHQELTTIALVTT